MPYCTQCGNQVTGGDQFCGKCGAAQPGARGKESPPPADFWRNVSDRNACLLCYLPWVGWIVSIAIMASGRFKPNRRVMFHAFQGLYLWVAWLLVDWVVQPIFGFGDWSGRTLVPHLLQLALTGAWIFMLVKVNQNEDYHLPFLGELAERSLAEQHR